MTREIHILLVDDDDLDVMNLQRVLGNTPEIASITHACDGLDALRQLRGGALPSERLMIVLDLRMPRMSGLELLAELRADTALAHLPVVVLTTSDDPRDRAAAFSLQAAGYFVKPGATAQLRQIADSMRGYWSATEFPPAANEDDRRLR